MSLEDRCGLVFKPIATEECHLYNEYNDLQGHIIGMSCALCVSSFQQVVTYSKTSSVAKKYRPQDEGEMFVYCMYDQSAGGKRLTCPSEPQIHDAVISPDLGGKPMWHTTGGD